MNYNCFYTSFFFLAPPPSNDVEHVPFHLLAHKNEEEKEEVEHTQEQDKLEDNVLSNNDITESN